MRTVEIASNAAASSSATASARSAGSNHDLLAALAGKQAARDRALAQNTRRVVMASLGVMQDQKADRKRSRSLALASLVVVLMSLGPFVWRVTDDLIGGEHLSDMATQTSLWVCILCPAVLAAAVFAGWARNKS